MAENNEDPRIIRTRKLIMDSLYQLLTEKEFKNITVKDVTTKAMINRATFYHHFVDKYDLLDKITREEIMKNVLREIAEHEELNDEMIKRVFLSITQFQMSLSDLCKKSYHDLTVNVEAIIIKELENIIFKLILKKHTNESNEKLKIVSAMSSWAIYGAAVDWQHHSNRQPEEYIDLSISTIKQLFTKTGTEGQEPCPTSCPETESRDKVPVPPSECP